MFKYKRGIGVGYDRQGYIYFLSRRYGELRPGDQKKIREMCVQHGGAHSGALFEFVTTDKSYTQISLTHYLSKDTLYRAVKRYYENFPEDM